MDGMRASDAASRMFVELHDWAENVRFTALIQIDVAQSRRMDMRPDKDCSDRARDGA